ncbi:hypothetical protein FOL47_004588 [Perkinsus chesapeaki]|uniref:Uncharacterized protein n=1 Tax=Perkinsus chesapeaki TaxID=330153 RepID=A0A7J6MZ59_PERCH|nr:hypothetical protein FOL47_004588 [Perkinsus chesapeaki]
MTIGSLNTAVLALLTIAVAPGVEGFGLFVKEVASYLNRDGYDLTDFYFLHAVTDFIFDGASIRRDNVIDTEGFEIRGRNPRDAIEKAAKAHPGVRGVLAVSTSASLLPPRNLSRDDLRANLKATLESSGLDGIHIVPDWHFISDDDPGLRELSKIFEGLQVKALDGTMKTIKISIEFPCDPDYMVKIQTDRTWNGTFDNLVCMITWGNPPHTGQPGEKALTIHHAAEMGKAFVHLAGQQIKEKLVFSVQPVGLANRTTLWNSQKRLIEKGADPTKEDSFVDPSDRETYYFYSLESIKQQYNFFKDEPVAGFMLDRPHLDVPPTNSKSLLSALNAQ